MTPAFSRDSRAKCLPQVSSVGPSAVAEAAVAFIDISRKCVWVDDIGQGGVFRQVLRGSQWVKCTSRLQNTDECSKCC